MTLAPDATGAACYLRLLANWGLGLAGLPLAVEDDDRAVSHAPGRDAEPEAASVADLPATHRN